MGVRWTSSFVSLRDGLTYTVDVYDDSFNGTPTPLIGAADPFVTQEDDDENIFTPVRTQTGYWRIVDTGKDMNGNPFNWREVLPTTATSRRVTLTAEGTVRWAGYIQAQTFSGEFSSPPIVRELPIVCQLGVLDGFDVATDGGDINNIAYLLYYLLNLPPSNLWDDVYFQGGDAVNDWLTKKVQWSNFVNYDDDGQPVSKYTALALLKEVCKFFGWTARTDGSDIYFSLNEDQTDVAWQRINIQDLRELGNGQPVTPTTISSWPMIGSLVNADFANADSMEFIVMGFHKATVKANINKRDSLIKVPYSDIADSYREDAAKANIYGTDKYYFYKGPDDILPHIYEYNGVRLKLAGGFPSQGAYFSIYDYYEGVLSDKKNYDWKSKITLFGGDEMLVIETLDAYSFDHGVLTINARVFQDVISGGVHTRYTANGRLYIKIRIGDKWYNPDTNTWGTTEPTALIPIYIGTPDGVEAEGEGAILSNSYIGTIQGGVFVDNPLGTYDGWGLGISSAIGGRVHIEIDDFQLLNQHGIADGPSLEDLTIGFTRDKTVAKYNDRSENEYIETNASQFSEEQRVDLIFASDNNNAMGLGILLNADGSYCSELTYSMQGGGGLERPEEHLAKRMAIFGNSIHNKYRLQLRSDLRAVTPRHRFAPLDGGTVCCPVSISHDWWNDVTTVFLIEK